MSGRLDDATWDQRRAWIEKQLRSGTSAARFCRENDLKLSNLNAWKRKFAGCDATTRPARADRTVKAMALLSGAFTQVPVQVGSKALSSAQWVEISLADGMVVRIPSSNLPALRLILGAFGAGQEAPMLSFSNTARIFIHALPTDMRKSFDALCGIVKGEFQKDILDGDYFVFFNRVLDRCKILLWDRDGLTLVYRRLEQGCFQRPPHDSSNGLAIEVDATTLTLILSGVDLHSAKRRKRYEVKQTLASSA